LYIIKLQCHNRASINSSLGDHNLCKTYVELPCNAQEYGTHESCVYNTVILHQKIKIVRIANNSFY